MTDPIEWSAVEGGVDEWADAETLVEKHLRRPGWSASRWVRSGDGQAWALPRLTFRDFYATPEIERALEDFRERERETAAGPYEPTFPWLGDPFAPRGVIAVAMRLNRLALAIGGRMLALNYFMTPERGETILGFSGDHQAMRTAVVDSVMESTAEAEYPVGWDEHDTVLFDN